MLVDPHLNQQCIQVSKIQSIKRKKKLPDQTTLTYGKYQSRVPICRCSKTPYAMMDHMYHWGTILARQQLRARALVTTESFNH